MSANKLGVSANPAAGCVQLLAGPSMEYFSADLVPKGVQPLTVPTDGEDFPNPAMGYVQVLDLQQRNAQHGLLQWCGARLAEFDLQSLLKGLSNFLKLGTFDSKGLGSLILDELTEQLEP